MWIDTKIAYEPGRQLAYAYNRAMENTQAEWVLFIDQDLFLVSKHWYKLCLNAIEKVGHNAGWITARCNRIVCRHQLYTPPKDSDDIKDHIEVAEELYKKYGDKIIEVRKTKFSGFFILTSKSAWKTVGGFRDQGKGLSKVDNDYCIRLQQAKFKLYVLPGLYCYHLGKGKWNTVWKGWDIPQKIKV